MRLFLSNHYYNDISIEIKKLNHIIAGNNQGKSFFMKTLKNSFEGKEKEFTLNGNLITKDDYAVFMVGENDTLDIEKTLSSKSIIRNELNSMLLDSQDLKECFSDKLARLVNEVNQNLLHQNISSRINLNINIDFNDLILKHSNIQVDNEPISDISFTTNRMAYIDLIINRISNLNRPCVLLIDEPFSNLDDYNKENLMAKLQELVHESETVIFVSSSCKKYDGFNPVYVKRGEVGNHVLETRDYYELIALHNHCSFQDVIEYTTDEELHAYKERLNAKLDIEYFFINNSYRFNTVKDLISFIKNKNVV